MHVYYAGGGDQGISSGTGREEPEIQQKSAEDQQILEQQPGGTSQLHEPTPAVGLAPSTLHTNTAHSKSRPLAKDQQLQQKEPNGAIPLRPKQPAVALCNVQPNTSHGHPKSQSFLVHSRVEMSKSELPSSQQSEVQTGKQLQPSSPEDVLDPLPSYHDIVVPHLPQIPSNSVVIQQPPPYLIKNDSSRQNGPPPNYYTLYPTADRMLQQQQEVCRKSYSNL